MIKELLAKGKQLAIRGRIKFNAFQKRRSEKRAMQDAVELQKLRKIRMKEESESLRMGLALKERTRISKARNIKERYKASRSNSRGSLLNNNYSERKSVTERKSIW